jgi:hypothetical protein
MRPFRVPLSQYLKKGLGSMPKIFTDGTAKKTFYASWSIILNVEGGVNKYLGELE